MENNSRIRNFSELDIIDEEGNILPIEETITEEQSIFYDSGLTTDFTDGQRVMLRLALRNLTMKQRQVLLCLDYHGLTQVDTAELLNITQQVVNKHYKLALTKLRKFCLDS